jgi:catechol 2,3-dioxygenase-like lactoylglutathione lyase family enzyme
MIGYVTIGTTDMEKSKAFWLELLEPLGAKLLMDIGRIAFIGEGMEKPILAVCTPYDENTPDHGNGNMLACPPTAQNPAQEHCE